MPRTYVRIGIATASIALAGSVMLLGGCAQAPAASSAPAETPAVQQTDPIAPADAAQDAVDDANRSLEEQGLSIQQ